jgi:hypothetical protein
VRKIHNSLEVYTSLFEALYLDVMSQFGVSNTECRHDLNKIMARRAVEGFAFFSKTLPRYGKALDKALSSLTPLTLEGLQKRPNSQIPKLFGCLFERVFNSDSGMVVHYTRFSELRTAHAVASLRQLFGFLYKLNIGYDTQENQRVLDGFVETDRSLTDLTGLCATDEGILRYATRLVSRVCSGLDPRDINPGHGPGAVATGETTFDKSNFKRIVTSIDKVYPFTEYFMLGNAQVADQYNWLQSLEVIKDGTAKVVLVPKDSRGPRLISCEPLENQWIQQGLNRLLVDRLESHSSTRGHVNFSSQEVNRDLALAASADQSWVTLDMKDASDRVSLDLVTRLFSRCALLDGLIACRSPRTTLPCGKTIELRKFAPMGSAVCFSVESFVFFALAYGVARQVLGYPERKALASIYVYGDDIIVRPALSAGLRQYFPHFGLMFNEGKCCTEGFFRESCGMDAFYGTPVTPLRLRVPWSSSTTTKADWRNYNASEIASYVSYRNQAYARGYFTLAERLESLIVTRYGNKFPYVREAAGQAAGRAKVLRPELRSELFPTGTLSFVTHENARHLNWGRTHRFGPYHTREYKGYVVTSVKRWQPYDAWREALRRLLKPEKDKRIGRRAIHRSSELQTGWIGVGNTD